MGIFRKKILIERFDFVTNAVYGILSSRVCIFVFSEIQSSLLSVFVQLNGLGRFLEPLHLLVNRLRTWILVGLYAAICQVDEKAKRTSLIINCRKKIILFNNINRLL